MKKGRMIFISVILGIVIYYIWSQPISYDRAYAFPEGFRGCAYIVYHVEDAPPLEIKHFTILYEFDEDGILLTSSPEDFGWEGKKHSGWYKSEFYYVDENGKKVQDIPQDMIGFHALGSYEKEGETMLTRETFSVGDPDVLCDTNYDDLLKKLEKRNIKVGKAKSKEE
ncbi:MAG: hypothetical protein H0Z31_13635 [Bacillus sp. (in: Bacteria)]|nr:hypothetical protein [Bacillus sp. (in: firmicutes)]